MEHAPGDAAAIADAVLQVEVEAVGFIVRRGRRLGTTAVGGEPTDAA